MTNGRAFLRWLGPWIRRGGWYALSLVGLIVVAAVAGTITRDAVFAVISAGIAVAWIRAALAPGLDDAIKRAGLLVAGAAGVQALASVLATAAQPANPDAAGQPSPLLQVVAAANSFLPILLTVVALLIWPVRRRARANWQYYVLDLGILLMAAGLLIWYYWLRDGANQPLAFTERVTTLGTMMALLFGTSAAAVRHALPNGRAGFLLLLTSSLLVLVANLAFSLGAIPEALSLVAGSLLTGGAWLATALAAEAVRDGWQVDSRNSVPDGASPVPWVAVLAIAIFVLGVVLENRTAGIGPVVLGALATMILLVIRQAITMRQNARLQAERAVLEADARIAALVRHTSDVILIADSTMRIRFASPSAEALWAGDSSRLLGSEIRDLFDPTQRAEVDRVIAERMTKPGQSDVARWRMPGPQGGFRRIEAVVTSLFHQPSVSGMVFTLRDQTERSLLEEQLNQAQKMEAIGQLAGGVAHDFNNLLTTMLGHSQVGIDSLEVGHPAREDFDQIRKAAELAASLTRQLLAFSRKQVVEPKVIDVTASLDQVVKLLRRLIKEDVTTVLEVATGVGAVRMDPSQLEQVVLNLAVNARDAMPDGGRLVIRARRHLVKADLVDAVLPVGKGDYVVVEVSDSGVGMDADTQARVFEPFFTTKPMGKGTGLGLASVYGIVKQNQGGLVLASTVGKGTTFGVYLPRVDLAPEVGDQVGGRSVAAVAGATILLVEDQAALREIAERVLVREGYRVLVASGGEEALMLVAGAPYPIDLVLTDVVMPGLSGPKMVAEMRRRTAIPRVLYVSGYPGDDLIAELGPLDQLLQKPFTPYVLLEQVRAVLERRTDTPVTRS